jgi:hypothetical protein
MRGEGRSAAEIVLSPVLLERWRVALVSTGRSGWVFRPPGRNVPPEHRAIRFVCRQPANAPTSSVAFTRTYFVMAWTFGTILLYEHLQCQSYSVYGPKVTHFVRRCSAQTS